MKSTTSKMPSLPTIRPWFGLHPATPQLDHPPLPSFNNNILFVTVDFQRLCKFALHTLPNGKQVCTDVPSEIGIALLNLSHLQGTSPGERGRGWFTKMRSLHIIPEEFVGHMEHQCEEFGGFQAKPGLHAFGKQEFPLFANVRHRLAKFLDSTASANCKESGRPRRKVVFMGWGLRMTLRMLAVLGFKWQDNYEFWDLQASLPLLGSLVHASLTKDDQAQYNQKPSIEMALYALGLSCSDGRYGSLTNNAVNDAVYQMQVFLAMLCLPHDRVWKARVKWYDVRDVHKLSNKADSVPFATLSSAHNNHALSGGAHDANCLPKNYTADEMKRHQNPGAYPKIVPKGGRGWGS